MVTVPEVIETTITETIAPVETTKPKRLPKKCKGNPLDRFKYSQLESQVAPIKAIISPNKKTTISEVSEKNSEKASVTVPVIS